MGAMETLLARIGATQNPGHLVAQGVNKITTPGYPADDALRGYVAGAPAFQPTIGGMLKQTGTDLAAQSGGFLRSLMAGDYEAAMNDSLFPMGAITVYHGTGKAFKNFSLDAPKATNGGFNKYGVSVSTDPAVAARYAKDFGGEAGRVMKLDAAIERPLALSAREFEKLQSLVSKIDSGGTLSELEDVGLEMLFKKHGIPFDGKHPIESIKTAGFDSIAKDAGRHGLAEAEILVFDPARLKTE